MSIIAFNSLFVQIIYPFPGGNNFGAISELYLLKNTWENFGSVSILKK